MFTNILYCELETIIKFKTKMDAQIFYGMYQDCPLDKENLEQIFELMNHNATNKKDFQKNAFEIHYDTLFSLHVFRKREKYL